VETLRSGLEQFITAAAGAPALGDHRQKFRTLIAANVLDIVAREIDGEEGRLRTQWERLVALDHSPATRPATLDLLRADIDRRERALCGRIRDGGCTLK